MIFDPLQTLALMPALLIPHRAFTESRSLRHRELNFIAISMFAATAIKGLTGLILPTLAIGLHTVIREWNMKRILKAAGKYLVHAFFPALFLSGVLFLQTPTNCGRLVFKNPAVSSDFSLIRAKDFVIDPEVLGCIFFPSWLEHYVEPNLSDEDRISLSFNFEVM